MYCESMKTQVINDNVFFAKPQGFIECDMLGCQNN